MSRNKTIYSIVKDDWILGKNACILGRKDTFKKAKRFCLAKGGIYIYKDRETPSKFDRCLFRECVEED
ncbi:MAG: hypothetical protein EOM03_16150 [Clostridia bacterium]|nr:hypothetical protein [Clostridia bacterium]